MLLTKIKFGTMGYRILNVDLLMVPTTAELKRTHGFLNLTGFLVSPFKTYGPTINIFPQVISRYEGTGVFSVGGRLCQTGR